MKVGFLTSSYPADDGDPRGIHVHRLAVALARLGVSMQVATLSAARSKYDLDGVDVFPLRTRAALPGHLASGISGIVPNLKNKPWRIIEVPPLLASMRQGTGLFDGIDLLHAHWLFPGGWAAVGSGRDDLPVVVTAHGGDVALVKRVGALRPIASRVLHRASHTVGVSHAISEDLKALGVPKQRLTTVPVGAPGRTTPALRARGPRLRVLYVGGLNKNKSVDTLLRGFSALDRAGRGELSIAGDGPDAKALQRLSGSLGLRAVRFLGSMPPSDVQRLLDDADVLVLPSRSEGKPTVVMEAMAAGLPVLATDIPGTRELVRHNETGWLFPVGGWEQLADQLLRIEADSELRGMMGRRAWEMSKEFDVDRVAEIHVSIYESLVGRL